MDISTLTIEQLQDAAKKWFALQEEREAAPIRIVTLDRGFVFVGKIEDQGEKWKISDCHNIRVWGTTKGLGELVNGPIKNKTQLDKTGTIYAPKRAEIFSMHVNQEKWTNI